MLRWKRRDLKQPTGTISPVPAQLPGSVRTSRCIKFLRCGSRGCRVRQKSVFDVCRQVFQSLMFPAVRAPASCSLHPHAPSLPSRLPTLLTRGGDGAVQRRRVGIRERRRRRQREVREQIIRLPQSNKSLDCFSVFRSILYRRVVFGARLCPG